MAQTTASAPTTPLLRTPRWPEGLGWAVLLIVLCLNVPLFLCLPLWSDVTLYDLAARNILSGGVHYRDIFDTNLPGMVWLHVAIRSVAGWRPETLRLADLLIVAGSVWVLNSWLGTLGCGRGVRVWTAAAIALAYFATPEWAHCQRDVWMTLPALGAARLCDQRTGALLAGPGTDSPGPAPFLAEGALWAAAFWIKPFVAVPALVCWLISTALVRRHTPGSLRRLGMGLAGVFGGGLFVLVLGLSWLVGSGAWPSFVTVMTEWNPEYLHSGGDFRLTSRVGLLLATIKPWGYLHAAAVPLALVAIRSALVRRSGPIRERSGLALLAALYLGWLAQVLLIQKPLAYCLVPLLPLAIAFLAGAAVFCLGPRTGRVPSAVVFSRLALMIGAGALGLTALAWHPIVYPGRLALWTRAFQEGSTPEMRERLSLVRRGGRTDWVDLARVADELRRRGVGDGEVTCYHDLTHPLYLDLGIAPSTPYLHFGTVVNCFPTHREEVRKQIARSRQRYVVSDLIAVGLPASLIDSDAPGLPPGFPDDQRALFPWHLPVIYRAGRYCVHETNGEVGPLVAPGGEALTPSTP
jgi:hypothetical protein